MFKSTRSVFKVLGLVVITYVSYAFPIKPIFAVVTTDQVNHVYTDTFTDTTGIATASGAGVNTGTGILQLRNASSGYTAPFVTSGFVNTTTIFPSNLAQWGTLSMVGSTPTGTTIKFQFMDENNSLFSDWAFPGNSTGFSGASIDLSDLPPFSSNGGKIGRIRVKVLFTTSDTAVTPSIETLTLSWVDKQGNLEASTYTSSGWGGDTGDQSRSRRAANGVVTYPSIKWVSNSSSGFTDTYSNVFHNGNYIQFGMNGYGGAFSVSKADGTMNWQKPFQGAVNGVGVAAGNKLTQNGGFYLYDYQNDNIRSLDVNDGSGRCSAGYIGGHGGNDVAIGSDGTVYVLMGDPTSNYMDVQAYNADCTSKWSQRVINGNPKVKVGAMVIDNQDNLYFFSNTYQSDVNTPTNEEKLYKFDTVDKTIEWEYSLAGTRPGDIARGVDGTIYISSLFAAFSGGNEGLDWITAVNPNGTLKWQRGVSGIAGMVPIGVMSDGDVVMSKITLDSSTSIEVRDATTGDVDGTYTTSAESYKSFAIDSADGLFVSTKQINAVDSRKTFYYRYLNREDLSQRWVISDVPRLLTEGAYTVAYDPTSRAAIDSNGWIFTGFGKTTSLSGTMQNTLSYVKAIAIAPLTVSTTLSSEFVKTGDTVAVTAVTSIPQVNPLTGENNKVQLYVDNGDTVMLTYDSTNNENTIWKGSYDIPAGLSEGEHSISIEVSQSYVQTDIATHFSSPTTGSNNTGYMQQNTFTVDRTSPTDLSIAINSDANYTKTKNVSLSLSAEDSSSGMQQMIISENSSFVGASWENYSITKSLVLSNGDGLKTVYVKFRDAIGNESSVVSDSIELDTAPPSILITYIGLIKNISEGSPLYYYFTSQNPLIKGIANGAHKVYFNYLDNNYSADVLDDNSFSIRISELPREEIVLTYFSVDAAGNQSAEKVLKLLIGEENFKFSNPETVPDSQDSSDEHDDNSDTSDPVTPIVLVEYELVSDSGEKLLNTVVYINEQKYITDQNGKIYVESNISNSEDINVELDGKTTSGRVSGKKIIVTTIEEKTIETKKSYLPLILIIVVLSIAIWYAYSRKKKHD